MQPSDLNLPSKFVEYRPGQVDALLALTTSEFRFSSLSANTGAGKSLIYMSLARMLSGRALVLTGTKGLQQQLVRDFGEMGLVDVRGRGNYRCPEYGGCDKPAELECVCSLTETGDCSYQQAVTRARESNLVVTNFAYWMSMVRYGDASALGAFDLLIIDEAHTTPDWLTSFCTVTIDRDDIKKTGFSTPWPKEDDAITVWSIVLRDYATVLRDYAATCDDKRERAADTTRAKEIIEVCDDIDEWANECIVNDDPPPCNWIVEKSANYTVTSLTPVWAHKYAERYLYRGIPRVVLSSATLSPQTATYLGIPATESDYHETDSGFSPTRRPFIYMPTTRVDYRMTSGQTQLLVNRMDSIIEGRLDRRGIVQARSYARAREVAERSRHQSVILTHDSRNTREVIAEYLRTPGAVLISPAVEEGWDFPYDACRYQIILKVPFVDGRQKSIKARSKLDPTYTDYLAVQSLVQQYGRSMRAADDAAEVFILDDHWAWFSRKADFPRWFKRAWSRATSIPTPMTIDERREVAAEMAIDSPSPHRPTRKHSAVSMPLPNRYRDDDWR